MLGLLMGRLRCLVRGLVFCGFWYGSICSGFLFLYCPLLPLLFLDQKLFRQLTDIVFAAWEIYPAALLECLIGTKVIVKGDAILPHDRALIIMNHRTRLDWNFLWAGMFHACKPFAHRIKMVLKASVRHIPGAGWVMQMNCFLYIHRRWDRDKAVLEKALDYFRDIGHSCQILLFPEGTDLTAGSQQRSHQFASAHQLERYYQVLHPKTTGFVFLVQRMRQNGLLDAVYDITVGYPHTLPQSEFDILKGRFPEEVHFSITRFAGSSLPYGEEELKDWLANRWKIKEQTLTKFYASGSFDASSICNKDPKSPESSAVNLSNGSFHKNSEVIHKYSVRSLPNIIHNSPCNSPSNLKVSCHYDESFNHLPSHDRSHGTILYLTLIFWTLLCFIALYGILTSSFIQMFAVFNINIFLYLSFFTQGFHHLEICLYRFKKKILDW